MGKVTPETGRISGDHLMAGHTNHDTGLTDAEARARLRQDGPNDAPEPRVHLLALFVRSFRLRSAGVGSRTRSMGTLDPMTVCVYQAHIVRT